MDRFYSIDRDFKSRQQGPAAPRIHRRHQVATIAAVFGIAGILCGIAPDDAAAIRSDAAAIAEPSSASRLLSLPLALPEHAAELTAPADAPPAPAGAWHVARVKNGDNLSTVFKRLGLSARQLQEVVAAGEETAALARLYPGDELKVHVGAAGEVLALIYDIDETRTLNVARDDGGFAATVAERTLERRIARASGAIDASLFEAAQAAGLSEGLTMELAGIFGWDIDFALDIRKDDRFTVIYEEVFLGDTKLRDGAILAAEFVNRGVTHRAVRYTDATGRSDYYSPDGASMRKAFLRSPVEFSRVSSRFSLGRKHPVLNTIRAHRGVDYAAPPGTPVKATGDGRVVYKGVKGGYGKTLIVQHGSSHSTLYAHLSGYARGLRDGARVRQGQTIGYVGSTGLATGPHLHYEFRVNGVHRNPLTVRLPDAAPLAAQYRADFTAQAGPLLAQFDVLDRQRLRLAMGEDSGTNDTIAFNSP